MNCLLAGGLESGEREIQGFTRAGLVEASICPNLGWDRSKYNDRYGPWFVDPLHYYLWEPRSANCIKLLTCTSSAQVLDWVMQLKGHSYWWSESQCLENWYTAGLMNLVEAVLHPQKNLCSWGNSKTLTGAEIRRVVTDFAGSTEHT